VRVVNARGPICDFGVLTVALPREIEKIKGRAIERERDKERKREIRSIA